MKRGLRGRLLGAVVLAVAAALGLTLVGFNLILGARLDSDATDLLRSRVTSTIDSLHTVDGRLQAQEAPDAAAIDRPIWIFSALRLLEAPQAGARLDRAARQLAGGPAQRMDVSGASTRLLSTPVVSGGRRVGTVVAGLSLNPYEQTKRIALIGSLVLAAVVLLAVTLAARWLLKAGLRPVARMSAEAAEWSELDLNRRFNLGPGDNEFTKLGRTLDGLLDRLSASLRREQRFSAELSHELRTPLAKLRARAQLALAEGVEKRETRLALEAAIAETDNLTRVLDTLVATARAEHGGGLSHQVDARQAAEAAASDCASEAAERALSVRVRGPESPLRVGAAADLIERILHPIVENACRYADSRVEISITRDNFEIVYTVENDGPGIHIDDLHRIFEPGVSDGVRGPRSTDRGAGLGLGLARRLARAAGGDVEALESNAGGRFTIRLPSARGVTAAR